MDAVPTNDAVALNGRVSIYQHFEKADQRAD